MKKVFLLSSLTIMSLVSAFAQKAYNSGMNDGNDMPARLNAIKLNISSLSFKNIAVQYERVLGPKISMACQVRYSIKGTLPIASNLSSFSNDTSNVYAGATMGGWAITPEFRFYPRHAMKGFYLAPYLRYRVVTLDYPLSYVDDNNNKQQVSGTGKFNSFGGGLMIGSHFNLGKALSLDWFIVGVQYMTTSGQIHAISTQSLSTTDQQDLRNDLSLIKTNTSKFVKDFSYNVNSNSMSVSSNFAMIGLRGFGINIGYRF